MRGPEPDPEHQHDAVSDDLRIRRTYRLLLLMEWGYTVLRLRLGTEPEVQAIHSYVPKVRRLRRLIAVDVAVVQQKIESDNTVL